MKFTIATDYSQVTGLRHCSVSDFSGEDFYFKKLNEAFAEAYKKKDKLYLVLDGVVGGYTPSFIDEAIGNLVYDFGLEVVKKTLSVVSEKEEQWKVFVNERTYPTWEKRREKQEEPAITERHGSWYRLINGKLEKKEWIHFSQS